VTPDQGRLVLSLVVVPGLRQPERASAEDILAAFDAADGPTLCRALLDTAVLERSPDEVDLTITLIDAFGWGRSSLRVLQRLAREPWHHSHEDISQLLEDLGGGEVVDDLEFLAWAGLEYQDYAGSTSLAKKVAHSLERIATPAAGLALSRLRRHPAADVRELVGRIERRMRT
jgi:hypothetical protein